MVQKKTYVFTEAPEEGISTCRSKGSKGDWIERTCDFVMAKRSLQGQIKNMEVVEDFELKPHKAVAFLVERDVRSLPRI